MRSETDLLKLAAFMTAVGKRVTGPGCIYLTGGATAVLHGWRAMTIDIDLKPDPEPAGFFEAVAGLKNELDLNIELASPDQFIPILPGWRERSLFIGRHGPVDFHHYDLYSQALSKLQRGHPRDTKDVASMVRSGLVQVERLYRFFQEIEPQLLRYPSIEPSHFRAAVLLFCEPYSGKK